MKLRPYQQAAVDAVYHYLRCHDDNPCIVVPTGGGKTPILATIVRDAIHRWNGRVMIVSHVKELLEQAEEKIKLIAPDVETGVYSAGLGRRDMTQQCIIAGIQSVFHRAQEFGHFDLLIVDEAHMIPAHGDGMFNTCIAALKSINPLLRVIGLTATPYRTSSGLICKPENILNRICYSVGIKELMNDGYLAKLINKEAAEVVDDSHLHIRGGEFIEKEVQALMNQSDTVTKVVDEMLTRTNSRKSVLVFCAGIEHAKNVESAIRKYSCSARTVFGDTLPGFRDEVLDDFKAGKIKYLVNVGVLTTGFDAPNIDCVVLLRPTNSPGLYYQMVGRGFRLHPDKSDCLVLDFGGNIVRHGPVDLLTIADNNEEQPKKKGKKCPQCSEVVGSHMQICRSCGHVFETEKRTFPKLSAQPSNGNLISGKERDEVLRVDRVTYQVHRKRDAQPGTPSTMRIDYHVGLQVFSQWICPEHIGYARRKFIAWWQQHTKCELPKDATDAVRLANEGALECPETITVHFVPGKRYPEVVDVKYPPPLEINYDDEIPF